MPKIRFKCHSKLTRDQNFLFKSKMLPELKVYNHGLSPFPMQNPYSKLILGIKSLFIKSIFKIFAAHFTTNLAPNIVRKIFFLSPKKLYITPENSLSKVKNSTVVLNFWSNWKLFQAKMSGKKKIERCYDKMWQTKDNLSHRTTKQTKCHVCPVETQISLGICPVWSESWMSAWRKHGSLATNWAHRKRLIRLGGCPGWYEFSLGAQSFCWYCCGGWLG